MRLSVARACTFVQTRKMPFAMSDGRKRAMAHRANVQYHSLDRANISTTPSSAEIHSFYRRTTSKMFPSSPTSSLRVAFCILNPIGSFTIRRCSLSSANLVGFVRAYRS